MFTEKKNLKVSFKGWIYNQLKIEADGLLGSLDKIWNDVKDSKWIGGNSEGWERFPYYLNGFVPLAYALDDEKLIGKANDYMNIILNSQLENGKICPKDDSDSFSNDIWSLFLILKVISIYGHLSNDERVIDILKNALNYIDKSINGQTIINWGHARYFECYIPMLYLKNKVKNKKYHDFLKKLAIKLKAQGLDYSLAAKLWDKTSNTWRYDNHGVNIAMALKESYLFKELTGINSNISTEEMLAILDKYHGTAYGHFSSDECLSSTSPFAGAELCGVVEAMYSYEVLYSLTRNTYWLHRLELLAFNALPATCSEDMWAHQYDQQVNQIACVPLKKKVIFKTNGNEANVFGLEPHFGCCTANFGQGFPLFALSCFESKNNTLIINIPLSANVTLNETNVEIKSEYPFRKTIKLIANKDIKVKLRIPETTMSKYKTKNGFVTLNLKANQEKVITLKYEPKLIKRNNMGILTYGPLLFSLPIKYKKVIKEYVKNNVERKYPYCDYYYFPKSKFKYGFIDNKFTVIEKEYKNAFSRSNPPVIIQAKFNELKWEFNKKYQYVLNDTYDEVLNYEVLIDMQPYGATYLRMTEMPILMEEKNNEK